MTAGLLTSGFPLAADYTIPVHVLDRPAPPPPTDKQPFGYRFREILRPGGNVVVNPVYDPEHQVTWIDGRLPEVKMGEGGGTEEKTTKVEWKYIDGGLYPDIKIDWIPDP